MVIKARNTTSFTEDTMNWLWIFWFIARFINFCCLFYLTRTVTGRALKSTKKGLDTWIILILFVLGLWSAAGFPESFWKEAVFDLNNN